MANHKSAKKRIRQSETRRVHNKFYAVSTRNAVRDLKATEDKASAEDKLKKVSSMLDKLAKKNIIHKNKSANIKSKLSKFVSAL